MKRILIFALIAGIFAMMTTSCKETLPKRFELQANYVEKHCDKFTEKDWEKANQQFEKLLKEYSDNKASFSKEDKERINAAIAKYVKLVTKSGVKSAVDSLKDLGSLIAPFLEGIGSFLNGLFGGDN